MDMEKLQEIMCNFVEVEYRINVVFSLLEKLERFYEKEGSREFQFEVAVFRMILEPLQESIGKNINELDNFIMGNK